MNQVRFAIVFVGRQGSSYLEALLNSHPDCCSEGELLSPAGPFSRCGHDDIARFLGENLHATGLPAVGFKMPLSSCQHRPGSWDILRGFGYRMIRLTRENLLDQYISMVLARLNNAWRSDFAPTTIHRFRADLPAARKRIAQLAADDETVRQMVADEHSVHATYEELVKGSRLPEILDFLDLPPAPLTSVYEKQRPPLSQSEIIENYEEMKDYFADTQWHAHFLD